MAKEFSLELNPCPTESQGAHRWIYYAACTLTDAGVRSEDAEAIIEELITRVAKPTSEVEDALRSAIGERKSEPQWASPIPKLIAKIASEGPTLTELASPFAASR